ncbi:MAG: DUF1232 domain-containing protein [Firmicutes bacterium]|nr:DUF1232 domain-containing protein [Bacillota bacterium]
MWSSLNKVFRRVRNLRLYLKDPNKSKLKKILIIFGIIYLLSPVDLLPEPVFGIGFVDDFVLWGFILSSLASELDGYTGQEGISREAEKEYRGRQIYESEARIVEDEEERSEGE